LPIKNLLNYNLIKILYVGILIYFSISFFITGYTNYSQYAGLSENLKRNYNQNENYDEIVDLNKNEKLNTNNLFNFKISKFNTDLRKFEWKNNKDSFNNSVDLNESKFSSETTEVASLMKDMISSDYDLDKVLETKKVPGFFIDNLPKDIAYIDNTDTRKKVFISMILPLIVECNRNISLKRDRINNIYNKLKVSKSLTINEHNWLINLAAEYSIETKYVHKITIAKSLLNNIDIIPNSIAIAQAAKESGWGTSRFAKEGNALFGEWTYDNDNGLLPFEREAGQKHLIRSFDSIRSSVVAYMKNINSHNAYKIFRNKRAEYRNQNLPLNSRVLVHELSPYAELPNYTDILFDIIKINSLDEFDNVILLNEISLV